MAKAYMPTPEELELIREYLVIDGTSKTGLRWIKSPSSKVKAGNLGLTSGNGNGYFRGELRGVRLYAHRVVFFLSRGYWPAGQVDHIDGNRANNHPDNLRDVTHSTNQANAASIGYRLIGNGSYQARIGKGGKHYSKTFATPEAARRWYLNMKRELYPEVDQWQWTQESAA